MPGDFRISSYATVLFGLGHQAPPWETWSGEMKCGPIPVLRLTANIDRYEQKHHRPCPPGQVIALARAQGLDPPEELVEKLLEERKQWRGRRAQPEPGVGLALDVSVVPPDTGTVTPDGGNYPQGTNVHIIATPAEGYKFDRWTGDYSGKDNPIILTMDSDKSVTAHFKKKPGGGS